VSVVGNERRERREVVGGQGTEGYMEMMNLQTVADL
jgi:hypothetical protein